MHRCEVLCWLSVKSPSSKCQPRGRCFSILLCTLCDVCDVTLPCCPSSSHDKAACLIQVDESGLALFFSSFRFPFIDTCAKNGMLSLQNGMCMQPLMCDSLHDISCLTAVSSSPFTSSGGLLFALTRLSLLTPSRVTRRPLPLLWLGSVGVGCFQLATSADTESEVRSEAFWVVLNAASCGSDAQVGRQKEIHAHVAACVEAHFATVYLCWNLVRF